MSKLSIFGKKLKALREAKGFSIESLSSATGIAPSVISLYENSQEVPGSKELICLGTIFDCSVNYFFDPIETDCGAYEPSNTWSDLSEV